MRIIVTGGLGFIGSHLIEELLNIQSFKILNLDKEGIGSNKGFNKILKKNKKYFYKKIDITNLKKTFKIINSFLPDLIFHLAAESHVDRSINSPINFIKNNIEAAVTIAESCRLLLNKKKIKLINISTDEVYGSCDYNQYSFKEQNRYTPNSPYSSSKASSDLILHSYMKTFGINLITTHTCNNFGERQDSEKFIPTILRSLFSNKKIPVYGNGKNIREWIYVKENVRALIKIGLEGQIGDSYNIGSGYRLNNLDIINLIINILNNSDSKNYSLKKNVKFVNDRKGHDFKYAINSNKIYRNLGINIPKNQFIFLKKTIEWYKSEWIK